MSRKYMSNKYLKRKIKLTSNCEISNHNEEMHVKLKVQINKSIIKLMQNFKLKWRLLEKIKWTC